MRQKITGWRSNNCWWNNNNSFINNQESDKDYDVNEDKDKEDSGEEAYYKPGETQLFTREKKKLVKKKI